MANCRSVHFFYQEDFWRLGQEKVKTSQVILTNHAYLLTRLEDDKSLLQESVLVVDEAQKLFFALEQFSQREENLQSLLLSLQHANRRGERSSATTFAGEYSI